MKRINFSKRTTAGFSLLEVLVAVVVLATGLLALAALQSSLARNSADAKARSTMAVLLTNELDAIRSGGYTALAAGSTTVVAGTDCTVGNPNNVTAASCDAAVNGLTLTRTVSEFSDSGSGNFVAGAPSNGHEAQFKHVVIAASWTDATGATRRIEQATVLSALALEVNSPLVSADPSGHFPEGPKVRQEHPFQEGMIPIAIGDGSDTAATNPKPVVVGTNKTLVETKFNVLTYRSEDAGTLIQQRIETTVIGCRCKYGNQTQLTGVYAQNFRPTYWNGERYVAPEMLKLDRPAIAGPAVVNASINPQSDLCTDCCRDHHDLSTDRIKFDPYRTDGHSHYVRSGEDLVGPVSTSTGDYNESCRVIRVDGLWRVATDFKVEHVGYVATGPSKVSQAPDPVYAKYYEKFVVDALHDRFAKTIKDGMTMSQRYDEPGRLLNDSALDVLPGSNENNDITIEANPGDWRYLHPRAVLIDYIEEPAEQKIKDALGACTKTGAARVECVLPHIPFTTINVTELARYAVSDPKVIGVIDGGVNFNDPLIVQGLVSGRTTAKTGDRATANVQFKLSNSALAAISPIDPQDAAIWLPTPSEANPVPVNSDEQYYVGINLTDKLGGENFWTLLRLNTPIMTDGNQSNDPSVRWRIGDSYRYPCGATTNASTAIPSLCETSSNLGLNVAFQVIVTGYNYWADPTSAANQKCPNSNNAGNFGLVTAKDQAKGRLCRRYKVSAATVKDVVGRGASLIEPTGFIGSAAQGKSEETTIYFDGTNGSHINPNEQINVDFQHVEDVQPALKWCHYRNLNSTVVDSSDWTSACD
jgi:type IV pilus modification protein PilV